MVWGASRPSVSVSVTATGVPATVVLAVTPPLSLFFDPPLSSDELEHPITVAAANVIVAATTNIRTTSIRDQRMRPPHFSCGNSRVRAFSYQPSETGSSRAEAELFNPEPKYLDLDPDLALDLDLDLGSGSIRARARARPRLKGVRCSSPYLLT